MKYVLHFFVIRRKLTQKCCLPYLVDSCPWLNYTVDPYTNGSEYGIKLRVYDIILTIITAALLTFDLYRIPSHEYVEFTGTFKLTRARTRVRCIYFLIMPIMYTFHDYSSLRTFKYNIWLDANYSNSNNQKRSLQCTSVCMCACEREGRRETERKKDHFNSIISDKLFNYSFPNIDCLLSCVHNDRYCVEEFLLLNFTAQQLSCTW